MGTGSFEVSLLLSQVHPLTCGLKSTEVSTSYLVIKGGKKKKNSGTLLHMAIISALGTPRQVNPEFKVSLAWGRTP